MAQYRWRCDCGGGGTSTLANIQKNKHCRQCTPYSRASLETRFWRYVRKSPKCWMWTGSGHTAGYGRIYDGRSQMLRAHRVSWELHVGPIPKGMYVLHHCDNPGCVRPDHLFLGDHRTNMRDMQKKGRASQRGERHYRTKLTAKDVRAIRRRIAEGEMQRDLAIEYGVSKSSVSNIRHRVTWAHVAP